MTGKFTLGKTERLKSRKSIEALFSTGKSITAGSCKLFYHSTEGVLLFAAGVSSKNFKKAVDRNRVKRLLRESWRLQRNELNEKLKSQSKGMDVFILYYGKDLPVYKDVFDQTGRLIKKLMALVK